MTDDRPAHASGQDEGPRDARGPEGGGRVPRLGGVVLCGGVSSRMGRPKAWLDFGGEPLLARVVSRVSRAAYPVVVAAAPGQSLPELPADVEVVRDDVTGRGPLQGIRTGLAALGDRADAAFVTATDVPFLAPELIRRLAALRAGNAVVVARTAGRHHPLCAVYATSVLPVVDRLLAADRLRPVFVFEAVPTLVADEPILLADPAVAAADPELASMQNVNTREDYETALARLGAERS